jgi:diaminopimelate decarboxylase
VLDQLAPGAHPRPTAPPLRVAIVGLGPKGSFALERLVDHAARAPAAAIDVHAYEPHPVPAAGPVYDPGQPPHLLMNFAAGAIDIWWPGNSPVPSADRRSFVAWSSRPGAPCDPAGYPPRADVGRYLAHGLRTLLAHAPPNLRVTVHPTAVRHVRPVDSAWELTAAGPGGPDDDAGRRAARYDEVLIATGHQHTPDPAFARDLPGSAPLVPAVFPVDRWLTPARVPAGATVAIRGFGLTFIDAALALTEGRGGRFEPFGDEKRDRPEEHRSVLPDPRRLRYRPGRGDPRVILPFSRTGRPMLAKPAPDLAAAIPRLEEIAERGRRRLTALVAPIDLRRDLLPLLAATTRANLLAAGAHIRLAETPGSWLAAAASGLDTPAGDGPADELRRSLAVGGGLAAPDLPWALGQTWRSIYPALVASLGADRLDTADWPAFRRLAAELERVSFGPPPINAAKLLALVDAGRVDLTHVRARLRADRGRTVLGRRPVDVVVDAVLPGPGAPPGCNPLLDGLTGDGHARVAPGRRGIDVAPDGSCRAADGSTTPGLAAIGRPTEDSVIGNDTLSRTLHPLADRWARRIVDRAARHAPTPVPAGVGVPVDGGER